MTAKGPPKDRGKLVTRMKMGPRYFGVCSLAASDAEVEDAGYSPPVPNPTTPLAMVIIQNIPAIVGPFEAVANIPPTTIIVVVTISGLDAVHIPTQPSFYLQIMANLRPK